MILLIRNVVEKTDFLQEKAPGSDRGLTIRVYEFTEDVEVY